MAGWDGFPRQIPLCAPARLLPHLGLPAGHPVPVPLGVRGQVVNQLPADPV